MNLNATLFCYIVLFYCLFNGAVPLYSQSVRFEYDSAGNRTSRTYYDVEIPQLRSLKGEPDTLVFRNQSVLLTAKVYPNPTKGNLSLSFSGLDDDETVGIRLYDSNGLFLFQTQVNMGTSQIDMSKMKPGLYLLQASSEKIVLNFKIIRE